MLDMNVLEIDGKAMPPVKSLSISREPIWSKNTGRGADGSMIGDVVAQKITLKVVFVPLSDEQAASLDAAIRPAFFNVKFKNPSTGNMETKTMYAGSPTYPVYSYVSGLPRYVGAGVDIIEK